MAYIGTCFRIFSIFVEYLKYQKQIYVHVVYSTLLFNFNPVNWDSIHDGETGILVYTASVGKSICEDLIHPHHDPHRHLLHESQWTNRAIITGTDSYNPFPLECTHL